MQTKSVCIACGGALKYLGKRDGFEILKCGKCGLGRTIGRIRNDTEEYHRDKAYGVSRPQFRNIFQKRVDLVEKFLKIGKVLEIGSSVGLLLSRFKKEGWDVEGVEPSKTAYLLAQKEGIPTQNTSFGKAKLIENFYDLVVFNHVLEHMDDSLQALKKIKKILKEGGLVFIDVPNFGGIKARMRGASWEYVLPKEHKWHFTRDSLERLLCSLGFEIVYSETRSGIWDYSNPVKELFLSLFGFKKRFFSELFFALPDFVVSKLGLGSGLTVIARKVG